VAGETILGGVTDESVAGTPAVVTEPKVEEPAPNEGAEAKLAENLVGEEKKEEEGGEPEKGEVEEAGKPEGAPETYNDFTIPEGLVVEPEVLAEAGKLFKDMNLSQEQAQTLVDFQAAEKQKEIEASQKAWTDQMEVWEKESKNDKEFGGAALQDSLGVAKKAMDAFGTDEFKQMLEITGTGNHPEMVRFLVKAGKAVKEDDVLHGSGTSGTGKSRESILFPNMN